MREPVDFILTEINLPVRTVLDPLSSLAFRSGGLPGLALMQVVVLVLAFLLLSGNRIFGKVSVDEKRSGRALPILTLVSAVLGLVNWRLFALMGFGSMLLTQAGLQELAKASTFKRRVLGSVVLLFAASFTTPLSPFVLLLLFLFTIADQQGEELRRRYLFVLSAAVLLLLLVSIPVFPLPGYPDSARVIPLSRAAVLPPPISGPILSPLTFRLDLDRRFVIGFALRVLLFGAGLCALIYRGYLKRRSRALALFLLASIVSFGSFGEAFFPIGRAPYETLMRLCPGLSLIPDPTLLSAVLIMVAFAHSLVDFASASKRRTIAVCLATIPLLAAAQIPGGSLSLVNVIPVERSALDLSRAISGSVAESFGDWVFSASEEARGVFNDRNRLPILPAKVIANPNEQEGRLAYDGDANTRWRTLRAQRSGDAVDLIFEQPVTAQGLRVRTDGAPTDFPRGVRIEVSENGVDYRTLLDVHDWIGALEFSTQGLPFFSSQATVQIPFERPLTFRELRIIQTAPENVFDWSVSEIELFGRVE